MSAMIGFDTTTSTGEGAAATGNSGITVTHSGTNGSPTSINGFAWDSTNFGGGFVINKFGGGFDPSSNQRPWGLSTFTGAVGDFGFKDAASRHMFDITFSVDAGLTAGTLRPITIFGVPSTPTAWDSEVSDGTLTASVQTYIANLRVVSPVPEPASFAVLGLGAVALIRRRKN